MLKTEGPASTQVKFPTIKQVCSKVRQNLSGFEPFRFQDYRREIVWAYRYLAYVKISCFVWLKLFFYFNAIIDNDVHDIVDWMLVSHCSYTNKNRGRQLTNRRTQVCNRKTQEWSAGHKQGVGMDLWRSKGEPPSVCRNRGRG